MRKTALLFMTLVMTAASAQKPTTGYAAVKGLKMDAEVHGSGEPVGNYSAVASVTTIP